jgi:Putative esterase
VLPWSAEIEGRFDELSFASEALEGNRLGDPSVRPLWVYLPPGYDESGRRYPTIYVIQGYTGQLDMWRNRLAFRKTFPELCDELFASGSAPACIVIWVDCWTSLGGSQFVDSPGTGRYHTYLCDEVVPWVDRHYRTLAERGRRGIVGKSSGGYGAALTAMLRPDLFGGFASHAGGGLFEVTIRPFFRDAVRALRDLYGGSYERFWEDFRGRPAFSRDSDALLVLQYGFSAAYSADPDGTVHLPYDLTTARVIPQVWERWLEWDTVLMVPRYAEALRSLRAIYIDAGTSDEWFVDLTAEALRQELATIGVTDVFFELFDATHANIEYRYPLSLGYLAERLSA